MAEVDSYVKAAAVVLALASIILSVLRLAGVSWARGAGGMRGCKG